LSDGLPQIYQNWIGRRILLLLAIRQRPTENVTQLDPTNHTNAGHAWTFGYDTQDELTSVTDGRRRFTAIPTTPSATAPTPAASAR